jgi:translation initiation factor 1A
VLNRGVSQGGKNRRRGKNENDDDKRELVFREDGQEYAQVIKMLGNGRLEAMCFDGEKRLAHIRGKMRKKVCIVIAFICMLSDRTLQIRCGSIKEISSCCRYVSSKMARRMS